MRAEFLKLSIVSSVLAGQCQRLGCIPGYELIDGKCVEVDLGRQKLLPQNYDFHFIILANRGFFGNPLR